MTLSNFSILLALAVSFLDFSNSFIFGFASSVFVLCSISAFCNDVSCFISLATILGCSCVANIDDAKVDGCATG